MTIRRRVSRKTPQKGAEFLRTVLSGKGRSAFLIVSAMLGAATTSQAVVIYWDGPTGSSWSSTNSWSTVTGGSTPHPSAVPSIGDDVTFNITTLTSAQTVNLSGSQAANSLTFRSTGTELLQAGGTNSSLTLGAGGITVASGAGAVTIGSTTSGQNVAVVVSASQTWANNSSNLLTLANGITSNAATGNWLLTLDGTGTGGITLNGALADGSAGGKLGVSVNMPKGTTTLSGTNTYSGDTTVSVGILKLGSSSAIPTGAGHGNLVLSGSLDVGTVNPLINGLSGTGTINTTGAGTFTATLTVGNNDASSTFSGVITDVGSTNGSIALTKTGTGTLMLSGSNAYNGVTTVGAGALRVAHNNSLGSTVAGTVVNNGAALEIANNVTVPAAETLTLNGAGIASGGALRNVSDSNTYAGAIILGSAARINSDSGTLTLSGGITGAGLALTISGSGNTTIQTVGINTSTAGTLTKDGSGALTISGSGNYTGATLILQGVLNIQNATALGTIAGSATVSSGAALQLQGAITVGAKPLTLNGSGVSNDGALRNISGNNTYGGVITLNSASRINSDAGALTLSGTVTGVAQNLTVGGVGAVTISNPVGIGAGTLTKDGAGTLTLAGSNAYTGTTTIADGALRLNNATALPGGIASSGGISALIFSGGVLGLGNGNFSRSLGTGASQVQFTADGGFAAYGGARTVNFGGASTALVWNSTPSFLATGQALVLGAIDADNTVTFQNPIDFNGASRTIQVDAGSAALAATLGGVLSSTGVGGLTKTGSGVLSLTAANTYSGDTVISSGALRLGAANVIPDGAGKGNVTVNGTLDLNAFSETINGLNGGGTVDNTAAGVATLTVGNNDQTSTFSGVVQDTSGALSLTKTGTGALTLSGNSSYSGVTTINAGTLMATTNANALGLGTLTLAGGTLALANDTGLAFNRNTTLTSNAAIVSDRLTPGVGVTHTLGTLSLGAQTLNVNPGSNITGGLAGITFGATTLSANGAVFDIGSGANLTLGALSGNFTLTKQDVGQITLNSASTRTSGTVILAAGTLKLGSASALGTTAVPLALTGGTLDLATDTTVNAYNTTVSGAATILSDKATAASSGTTHTLGTLTIGANQLNVGPGSNVGSGVGGVAFGATTLSANGAVFDISAGANLTLGALSGNFTFTKQDGGQLTLNSASTRSSGTVNLAAGTLKLGNAGALGTTAVPVILSGGTFDLATDATVNAYNVTLSGSTAIAADRATAGAGITHTLGTVSIGNNQLNISAGSNVTSGTAGLTMAASLTGKAIFETASGALLTLSSVSGAGQSFTVQGTGNTTISGVIATTTGGVTKNGTGTLTASGANTYSGVTLINAGTFKVGNAVALGSTTGGTTVAGDGAALDLNGQAIGAEPVTLNGSGISSGGALLNSAGGAASLAGSITLGGDSSIGGSGNMTLSGPVGGSSWLTKVGAGTVTLSGNNSGFTGTLAIGAGTVQLGSAFALSAGFNTTVAGSGAALDLNGQNVGAIPITLSGSGISSGGALINSSASAATLAGPITLANDASVGGSGNMTLSGAINGNFVGLTKVGTGTVTLSADNSGFAGSIAVSAGILQLGSGQALGIYGANVAGTGAALDLNGQAAGAGPLDLNGTGIGSAGALINSRAASASLAGDVVSTIATTYSVGGTGNVTLTGNVQNTLTKVGSNTLTLAGTVDNVGLGVIANAGTVVLGKTSNANVHAIGGGALTIAGANVQLAGTGGDQIYDPASVTLTSGTLDFNGRSEAFDTLTGAGAVVNNGGGVSTMTLGAGNGGGTFSGVISDHSTGSGTITLTKVGTGTATLSSANTYTGATVVDGGILTLSGASGAAPNSASWTVNYGATLTLDNTSNNTDRLGTGTVTLNGGKFNFTNPGTNNVAETTGTLVLGSGASSVITARASSPPAKTSTLTFASLTRSLGATVTFSGTTSLGADNRNRIVFTSPPTLVNGIIGGWATVGTEFAVYNSTGTISVAALGTYTTTAESTWTSGTNNVKPGSSQALTADRTVNSMNLAAATAVNISGATRKLTIATGGLLASGADHIVSTGTITAGSAAGAELITTVDASRNLTISSVVANNSAGGVALVKSGLGTVTLSGSNSFTGGVTVNQGTVKLSNAGALNSANPNAVAMAGGILSLNGNSVTVAALSGNDSTVNNGAASGAVTLTVNQTGNTSYSGVLENGAVGTLALVKSGVGTLTLNGANTYSGPTTLAGGVLSLGIAGALGNTTAIAFTGGTLQFSANNTTDYSNLFSTAPGQAYNFDTNGQSVFLATALSGSGGSLTKSGSGTLTVTGSPTFNGPINVTAGTVIVSGSLGASPVTVSSRATLSGAGLLPLTFQSLSVSSDANSGGTLAPGGTSDPAGGVDGVGIMNVNGNVTLGTAGSAGKAHLSMEIGGTTAGIWYDQLSMLPGSTLNLANVNLEGSLINGFRPATATGPVTLDGDMFFLVIGADAGTTRFANEQAARIYSGGFSTISFSNQEFAISYSANFNGGIGSSFTGGHDIALMALPEPGTPAMLIGGCGMLAFMNRLRRRKLL